MVDEPRTTPRAAEPRVMAVDPAEVERLQKQLYDYRKTCDPILYERVIPYHPHAATNDEAFATFTADCDRVAAERGPPPDPPIARDAR